MKTLHLLFISFSVIDICLKIKYLNYLSSKVKNNFYIITDYLLTHNAKVEYNTAIFQVIHEMKNLVANSPCNMINNDKHWHRGGQLKF